MTLEAKSLQFLYKKFINSAFAIIKIYDSFSNKEDANEKILQMSKDFSWVLYQLITPENYFVPNAKSDIAG